VTEAERRNRLINWLEIVYSDVQQLLLNDYLFWEFQRVVDHNDEFLGASGLFTQFIAQAYAQSGAVGVRRHAKADDDSISILRFLREVRDYPEIVSVRTISAFMQERRAFTSSLVSMTSTALREWGPLMFRLRLLISRFEM
jgi:hypothetical protein